MNLTRSLRLFALTLVIFLGIDSVWLLVLAKSYYADKLGYLMATQPNLLAALLFYLLFTASLIYFVIDPALKARGQRSLVVSAALFGLVTYATYDLTNLATVRDWPVMITLIDLAWGTTLSTIVAVATVKVARKYGL